MRKPNLLFIHLALGCLLVWWSSPLLAAAFPGAGALGSLLWTLTFGVMGFFTLMVFGIGYLLIPAMLRARLYRPLWVKLHLGLAAVALGGLGVGAWIGSDLIWGSAALSWFAGSLLFIANVALTIRHRRASLKRVGVGLELPTDRFGIALTVASGLYMVAGTLGLSLVHLSPSLGLGNLPLPPFLHLYLLGFVTNMIFGVGYHLIPRFLGAAPHRTLAMTNVVLPLAAPALIAATMQGRGWPFIAAAALEATAAVAFSANVISMFLRRSRRLPPAHLIVVSATALLLGPSLGVAFAVDPLALAAMPVHMTLNLYGFVSFMIFGVSLHIMPRFPNGQLPPSYTRTYAVLGLGVVGLSMRVAATSLAALGLGMPPALLLGADALLLGAALAYASSVVPTTMLIWRTGGPQPVMDQAAQVMRG